MPPIRIGIVGVGHIAMTQHLPALATHEDVDVSIWVSRNPGRAMELAQSWSTAHDRPLPRIVTNLTQLDPDPPLDALVISSPTQSHFEAARWALITNLHVLLEKPMTAPWVEADT